ncbi:HAD phosphatase, family IIIA [Batrachochytrium salamandrivorans]|nr:HAD phosphatase, family IIIA [Batrachochytrium salamandrivorans]KAH9274865.1 HAD phosphatase, family IIIA [Batrachochytrium salamandrivorans]KAJ1327167.1 HAD phosphatase, family IIIA [Batrachochytrium salamandrivorans]
MVQSINLSGLKGVLSILFRPSLAVPHLVVDDISSLPFAKLKLAGFKAIAFDKDNTLTAPYACGIHPPFQMAWERCLDTFGSENMVIVSNSAGSSDDRGHNEAKRIELELGVHVLRHTEKKPDGGQTLVSHFNCQAHEIVFVGDRLFTDVVYATRIGAFSVLTYKIITETNDNWFAKHIRRIEHRLLHALQTLRFQSLPHKYQGQFNA